MKNEKKKKRTKEEKKKSSKGITSPIFKIFLWILNQQGTGLPDNEKRERRKGGKDEIERMNRNKKEVQIRRSKRKKNEGAKKEIFTLKHTNQFVGKRVGEGATAGVCRTTGGSSGDAGEKSGDGVVHDHGGEERKSWSARGNDGDTVAVQPNQHYCGRTSQQLQRAGWGLSPGRRRRGEGGSQKLKSKTAPLEYNLGPMIIVGR